MVNRGKQFFHLTDAGLAQLRSKIPFSDMPEHDREYLEEYLQTALGGVNRIGKKLLNERLNRARELLGLEEESASWAQLKAEIENSLSMEPK